MVKGNFRTKIEFEHRHEPFHYVPDDGESRGNIIVGKVGRKVRVFENDTPEANLVEVERDIWQAANVLIDPSHHADGQKGAIEHVYEIGRPIALFESLTKQINRNVEPFLLEANAIVPTDTFWSFVGKHKNEIVFVEFEFVVPNIFGGADTYDEEMRELAQTEKVQKAKFSIESKDSLNLETARVRAAATYTSRGTGSIIARTKKNNTYNSKSQAKKVTISRKYIKQTPKETLFKWLADLVFSS